MNAKKSLLAAFRVVGTNIRLLGGRIAHGSKLKYSPKTCLAYSDEIALSKDATIEFGTKFRTRGRCRFSVQESGVLSFGDDVFINSGCQFNCRQSIRVGSGCEFGPNVLVYDHDHDFRSGGGIGNDTFSYGSVSIGDRCWIGAGTIILRGTTIGDNCVIAAGSILKGSFSAGSIILQKRETETRVIARS